MSVQSHQAMVTEQMNHLQVPKTVSQGHIVEDIEDSDCLETKRSTIPYDCRPQKLKVYLSKLQPTILGRASIGRARSNDRTCS